ncbi:tRNA wybutosine-synthesizing protein 2 homolog [Anneissia japonica]|uniref:tRNA wybutosine-synthesizing protein 2 homolog n=1 Tax=Anneissia japonica TaxID=1529436 RepID=UPI001425B6AD|nr:tRNA wybutosine-synthesizing protein 2 homolog [Anneissia japonica]
MDVLDLAPVLCVMVKPRNAKLMRNTLTSLGVIDKTKKTIKCGDDVAIPIQRGKTFKHLVDISTDHLHVSDNLMKCACISCRKTLKSHESSVPRTSATPIKPTETCQYGQSMEACQCHDDVQPIDTCHCDDVQPIESCQCDEGSCSGVLDGIPFNISIISHKNFKKKIFSPVQRLEDVLSKILANHNISLNEKITGEFPKNWETHGDLVLLPSQCLTGDIWKAMTVEDWQQVAAAVGVKRLAHSMGAIQRNGFRTPNVRLLLGNSGWVEHIDNGIRYSYDVTKCMFSSGNITEKIRVAKMECSGETVVDLYAGIGYFTLPYLVHANAAFLHACEWNPHAVNALKRNLVLNNVQDRCAVYEGDNRQICPTGVADRVNLGLIPTSSAGWPVACQALKSTGGILHIHGNVSSPLFGDHSDCHFDSNSMLENSVPTLLSCGLDSDELETQENKVENQSSDVPKCEHSHMVINNRCLRQEAWKTWSHDVSRQINQMCVEIKGGDWSANVLHIEKVKSYAPHIDHIVVNVECRPLV